MERNCDACRDPYEAQTARSRFCCANCRIASHKGKSKAPAGLASASATEPDRPGRGVQAALAVEFEGLGVAAQYEARVALGLAEQLDSRVLVGGAFVSLSKELDRRVDALRLQAERPGDPAVAVKDRLAAKRLRLA